MNLANKDGLKAHNFYSILDSKVGKIKRLFSTSNYNIINGIHALSPDSVLFLDKNVGQLLAERYETDVEDFSDELHQGKRILEGKFKRGMEKLSSLAEFTRVLEPFKQVLNELFRLYKITVTITVITDACERRFSTLKLVNTHLRSSMVDNRLNNLSVISIESECTKSLDIDKFFRAST